MGEVFCMPGVYRADLAKPAPVDEVLKTIQNLSLSDITCVARSTDGAIVVCGSQSDPDAMIGLLVRGMNFLAEHQAVDLVEDEGTE